jgi:hypothetical protein
VYSILIEGDADSARSRLADQSWVSDVSIIPKEDHRQLLVNVTDETAAEQQLLRLLLSDDTLIVRKFGRREYELEEVFVNIVEGGSHGG